MRIRWLLLCYVLCIAVYTYNIIINLISGVTLINAISGWACAIVNITWLFIVLAYLIVSGERKQRQFKDKDFNKKGE